MKRIISLLLTLLSLSSCSSHKKTEAFDFKLRWSIHANFMYDAKEEKAYKEYLSSEKENYSGMISFSDDIKKDIINRLNDINIYSYPDNLDPYKSLTRNKIIQTPGNKIILDLNDKVIETSDDLPDISNIDFRKKCTQKAIRFFDCIEYITNYITNTDKWKEIPEDGIYFL